MGAVYTTQGSQHIRGVLSPKHDFVLSDAGDENGAKVTFVGSQPDKYLWTQSHVESVTLSPGGEFALAATTQGIVHVWEVGSWNEVTSIRLGAPAKTGHICW